MARLFALLFAVSLFPNPAAAAEYLLDKAHAAVGFEVSHMMVSKTKGTFGEIDGLVRFDPKAPEKTYAEGTVMVKSIDTANEKRDNHLRNADFFDVEKFPTMTIKTKKVTKSGDRYDVVADLTIKGVTKEVKFPAEIRGPVKHPFAPGKSKIGFDAEFTIDRQDFGMRWSKTMEAGGLVVGNDVTISISAEADSK